MNRQKKIVLLIGAFLRIPDIKTINKFVNVV